MRRASAPGASRGGAAGGGPLPAPPSAAASAKAGERRESRRIQILLQPAARMRAAAPPPYAPMASSVVRSRSRQCRTERCPLLGGTGRGLRDELRRAPAARSDTASAWPVTLRPSSIAFSPTRTRSAAFRKASRSRRAVQYNWFTSQAVKLGLARPAHARRLVVTPLLLEASPPAPLRAPTNSANGAWNSVSSSRSRSVTEDWQEERPRSYPYQS